jgi:glutamate-1-semialdehyde aminotransferase
MYDVIVQGYPSMFQVLFTKQNRVYNYRDFITCNRELFAKLQGRLLEKGIMVDEYNSEAWYTSAFHNISDVGQTLEGFQPSSALLSSAPGSGKL